MPWEIPQQLVDCESEAAEAIDRLERTSPGSTTRAYCHEVASDLVTLHTQLCTAYAQELAAQLPNLGYHS